MPAILALAILALQYCELCVTVKVPIVWDGDNSEVKASEHKFSVEQFKPLNFGSSVPKVPINYFEYTAKKPQFAVDVSIFHGVQSPENHFKSYPVRPYTGRQQPILGRHKIQDPNRPVFQHFQKFINQDEQPKPDVTPVSANYEVFHPYKVEEQDLKNLYKDPVLDKIRNDIRDSSLRLQKHENEAGKADITKDEYLESLEQTDNKKRPQQNIPAYYENHRPQRRPIYYQPYQHHSHRDHVLNQRFKHPWNQNFVKIRPLHYRPLKNHLQKLRQHHALTYDDERNEYPQAPILEPYENPTDGYDIYEKGKEKYKTLRNNLDESINNLVRENHPVISQKLELQNNEKPLDEEDEFVPVKSYAQVRKTETTKHLPKEAAFDDAETYEEIKNAPRLREAIKSTKAQTVYTEEGYEDSAYDHAGEQKHASDHEAHGGFLREKELSGGKYKAPSVSASFDDGGGSAYKDQIVDAKKWNNNNKDTEQEEDSEDYAENEHEHSQERDTYSDGLRNKRQESQESENEPNSSDHDDDAESDSESDSKNNITSQHDLNKRETTFKIPSIDLNSTFLNEKDILEIANEKLVTKDDWKKKYPYYFKSTEHLSKDSPLRYAENLKLMPLKSKGGTEFYDSRSQFECPEVDEKVNAIPEKFKKNGHPDEPEEETDKEESKLNRSNEDREEPPRLQGLGDKIDCFKAKYFGEDPLDSPFFKEDIIANPEPILLPNISILKQNFSKNNSLLENASDNILLRPESKFNKTYDDIYSLLEMLKSKHTSGQNVQGPQNISNIFKSLGNSSLLEESHTFYDVLQNIKNNLHLPLNTNISLNDNQNTTDYNQNKLYNTSYDNYIKNVNNTNTTTLLRHRRSTPFLYEPYKIIRDIQPTESKKTTTTNNISPLIKQLQSSTVIDKKVKPSKENDNSVNLKRNVQNRTYKDIGRKDRVKFSSADQNTLSTFVNVNVDSRRGEPRYELRPSNHKSQYTPVENKKAMSVQDYEHQTKKSNISDNSQKRPSATSLFNIANNYKKSEELLNLLASSSNRRTVTTSPSPAARNIKLTQPHDENDSEEEYDEDYEDEEEEEEITTSSTTTTTTTTTTPKPIFRRRIRSTTSTEKPSTENTEEPMRLRLVTRFRNTPAKENVKRSQQHSESSKPEDQNDDESLSKYREKKRKSSKSTIVTDTKRYGSDEDDKKREEEIDALIGVKHSVKEYMPSYEKNDQNGKDSSSSSEEDESDESYEDEGEDDEGEDDDFNDDEEIEEKVQEQQTTTTTAPKRTLVRTTDAPPSPTEAKSAKLVIKPVVSKKKIEVHKELPVNKSSPHVTQFKQDIEEVEIIKEIPRKVLDKKQNKNIELLDLYKDDNLATDINKLGAVEVFKENLDLKNGPKHGGNYKHASNIGKSSSISVKSNDKKPKDAETSQTENKKLIELDDTNTRPAMHGGNLRSISDIRRSRGNSRNAKLVELSEITERPERKLLHGGNLKSVNDRNRRRGGFRSEKLIELEDQKDDEDDEATSSMHGGNFRSYGGSRNSGKGLHGGNYRSSKLIQPNANENQEESSKQLENSKGNTNSNLRINSADLLNSFAQAVPILTTTPAYILDPSKRMYYYVD